MKRTPLEVVEDLATERFGAGAAVSVDRKAAGFVITAWAPNGIDCVSSAPHATKALAIRDIRQSLKGTSS